MTAAENPHAGQGMVVLDIGGDIGALIITAPAALVGTELEICPTGRHDEPPDDGAGWWVGDWRRHRHGHDHAAGRAWPHVAVLARPTASGPQHSAVFPGLRAGIYDLWLRPKGRTALTVAVTGGRVTETSWPDLPMSRS